nr:MAG TPA: hypothetical protein [Bacteriophage sp.]
MLIIQNINSGMKLTQIMLSHSNRKENPSRIIKYDKNSEYKK